LIAQLFSQLSQGVKQTTTKDCPFLPTMNFNENFHLIFRNAIRLVYRDLHVEVYGMINVHQYKVMVDSTGVDKPKPRIFDNTTRCMTSMYVTNATNVFFNSLEFKL